MSALSDAPAVPGLPRQDATVYLPNVHGGKAAPDYPCGMVKQAWEFAQLWMAHPEQRRPSMRCHKRLVQAAHYRANVIVAERGYMQHTSRAGETANEAVRRFYRLPAWYDGRGNNVEGLAGGQTTAKALLRAILDAPSGHKDHLLATYWSFEQQTNYGVAYVLPAKGSSTYSPIWVWLSAPPEEGDDG